MYPSTCIEDGRRGCVPCASGVTVKDVFNKRIDFVFSLQLLKMFLPRTIMICMHKSERGIHTSMLDKKEGKKIPNIIISELVVEKS